MEEPSREQINELYTKGISQIKIAEFLGISRQRVHQIIRKIKKRKTLKKEKRNIVLTRDNFRCFFCYKVDNLEIHHIDNNPFNNHISNLITLCRKCHREFHKKTDNKLNKNLST